MTALGLAMVGVGMLLVWAGVANVALWEQVVAVFGATEHHGDEATV